MARLDRSVTERVAAEVAARAGLRPPGWVLEARVERRMSELALEPAAYLARLGAAGGAELDRLIETIRVGETRFFRHRGHVQALTEVVVPALREHRPAGEVRAWSAGCASGEEAYTLAMVLSRELPPPTFDVHVLATDLSAEALAVAAAGQYPEAAASQVPQALRQQAFVAAGPGRVVVADWIRNRVRFEQLNLHRAEFPRAIDVVFCRNVLIYFAADARAEVVRRLVDSLSPGGFLFVGYAESLRDVAALEVMRAGDAVLYRKPRGPAPVRRRPTAPPVVLPRPRTIPPTARLRPEVPAAARAPERRLVLCGSYDDDERLTRELGAALADTPGKLVVELDGAEFLGRAAAGVLRRARAAARANGVDLILTATRPATCRWIERTGLHEDPP